MRYNHLVILAVGIMGFTSAAFAQGFTAQELDRMSKQNSEGRVRNFGPPPPLSSVPPDVVHQPPGIWVCMGTDEYIPILGTPQVGAPSIAQSMGQIAAGADKNGYTSVLVNEGKIGYVPKSAVKPYKNQFNPGATCSFLGVRQNGLPVFKVR